MFLVRPTQTTKRFRSAIAALLALSIVAFVITVWVMVEFLKEQETVKDLIQFLPPESASKAETLAGELRWQFRLSTLVILNLVVTAFAVVLLWRAYQSSQESLRDVKAFGADVLSSMAQAVLTTDMQDVVTSINQRGMDMLGVTEQCIGRPLRELPSTIPLQEFQDTAIVEGSVPATRDFSVPMNGNPRTLRVFCHVLRNYEQQDVGKIIQLLDVTEHVLIEERMLRMERYMGLGSLAAGLHHEIKNPLAALSLHVQLLEEQLDQPATSEEVHDLFRVIKTEVARVGGVLENFSDFASLAQLNTSSLDIESLIDAQTRLIRPRAKSLDVEVRIEPSPSPLPRINVDRVRLEQVLQNLLINSLEAMPDGGTLTVRTLSTTEPETIQIQVIDTGSGIPESLRERIFDPYFTTKSAGTGMGLALCDKIIRQHNGTLEFHCSDHQTVFQITLPVQHQSENSFWTSHE